MQTRTTRWLKGGIPRWTLLTALVIGAAAVIGWSNQKQYRLGGGWISSDGEGNIVNVLQIPLDPAGRTAAVRLSFANYNDAFAGLLQAVGADSFSDAVGEERMVGRDTASYRCVFYLYAQANPPTRRAIAVVHGTVKFTGPNHFETACTIDVYPVNIPGLSNADVDADGLPDPGNDPIFSIPVFNTAIRVPAL